MPSDVPFTSYLFAATGSPTSRTLPDRLADINNVKDFGVTGDGVTDDWAAIMACFNWQTYSITTNASNLVASFTGVVSRATFTGTISGNALVSSSVTGTIAIGQTLSGAGVTSCKIVSGSGSAWVVDGSPQTVGPVAITTDQILVASSVTGTIAVGDYLINNGGTDASPSTIIFGTQVLSDKGGGVYSLTARFNDALGVPILQNFTSQAMMTVSTTLHLSTPVASTLGQGVYDRSNATFCGDGVTSNGAVNFVTSSSTITVNSGINGLVQSGDTISFQYNTKGEIYFPPGNYYVSRPIIFATGVPIFICVGTLGATTISGNFADYVIQVVAQQPSTGLNRIDGFSIVNSHANGGGIRAGSVSVGVIANCSITANRGINDYLQDTPIGGGGYFGAFELSIENCTLSPGANYSGSIGIARQGDGPITNCTIQGYERGFITAGGQGCQVLLGCRFEQCGNAIELNRAPDGGTYASTGVVIAGCLLKNNSVGLYIPASTALMTCIGVRIEGSAGQAPGGTDPQYGIRSGVFNGQSGQLSHSMIAGVTVVGTFAVSGIYMTGHGSYVYGPEYLGVADRSTCPDPFDMDTSNAHVYIPDQIACSARHIYTVATLPLGNNAGQTINVSDGTNGLGWGDTLIGTGTHTTHYAAQWNGSNWTVVGK